MHTFVADFGISQYLEGVYCIQNAQLGRTRSGNPFLKALISDRTGRVTARKWNISEQEFGLLPTEGFVQLQGETQPYQGELQLIIQRIRAVEVDEEDLHNLLPSTSKDIAEMFGQLRDLLETITHPGAKALASAYLEDESLMRQFRMAPAAVSLHHAYLGGLLEHTLQVCRLADLMCPLYPDMNRDLLLLGLFLHDMAKCKELKFDTAFSYSDEGLLLGHLVMGSLLLQRKARQAAEQSGEALPRAALLILHHIIVSHHGSPEYGAAKIPASPEAVFIARLDELDAKTQMSIDAARRGDTRADLLGGNFTEKLWALQTRLFRPDPLAPASDDQ